VNFFVNAYIISKGRWGLKQKRKMKRYWGITMILMTLVFVISPAFPTGLIVKADTPKTMMFDLGTASSPVAAGYTHVSDSTLYSSKQGYGLQGSVSSRLRTGGDDATNDFVFGTNFKFLADVPDGQYDVTVFSGDLQAGTSTTKTTVSLGGQTMGTISSKQAVTSATYRTTVSGGQLVVGITGTSGYLNALIIKPVLPTTAAPDTLTITNIDSFSANPSVSLSWNSVADATAYRVYRQSGTDSFGQVTETSATNFTDTGVTLGNSYSYKVSALNANGVESGLSNVVTATVQPSAQTPPSYKFDFGSATSPVAEGYTQVTNTTLYTAQLGYGLSALTDYRDRGTTDNLTRDFVISPSYSFRVDLPDGQYDVKIISGDASASNKTTIAAEGISLGTISSSSGQFGELDRYVTVTDGALNLDISGNGRLNALEIAPYDPNSVQPITGVQLKDTGSTVTLQNSKIKLTVNKSTAEVTSMYFTAGHNPTFNIVGGTKGRGYYLADYYIGLTKYEKSISNAVFKVVSQTDDRVEISMNVDDPTNLPFYLEVHMVLEKDSPGIYYYSIYKYTDNMPEGLDIDQTRYAFALDDPSFTYFQVDDQRGLQQRPSASVLANAPKLQDETWLLPGGDLTNGTGSIWTKYKNISNTEGDNHVFMASNGQVGVSLIQASKEAVDGGPTKQELTVHQYDNGLILLGHDHTGHYGTPDLIPQKGWSKMYGPMYLYINEGSDQNASPETNMAEMWNDAKAQADKEEAKWPYQWITDPAYGLNERSDVSGKLTITDGSSPNNAWVILSNPGEDWQTETNGYKYQARADLNGNFTLHAVRPGTYTLTAFVDGVPGEYKQENVTVGAATPLNLGTLTWSPEHYGKMLWQIGTFDRSAQEFHVFGGDNGFRNYLTWLEYPYEFPNGVDFKVGESDIKKDWNYFQPMYKTPGTDAQLQMCGTTPDRSFTEWKIRFDSGGYTNGGTGTLNIALASSVFGSLQVKLNGTPIAAYAKIPGPDGDNALYRQAIRGVYRQLDPMKFDASLIKKGENVITLTPYVDPQAPTSDNWMQPMASIMYDALRLEVDSAPVTIDDAPQDWVNNDVTVHLSATDDQEVAHTYYSINGGDYAEGNTIQLTQDGIQTIDYYSVDNGGNKEAVKTATVKIDKTGPNISVAPISSSYLDSDKMTLNFSVSDNGSGVNDSRTTATLDGQPIENNTELSLYKLPLGSHTVSITAFDVLGNMTTEKYVFETRATLGSIDTLVDVFSKAGNINNDGIVNSLHVKLKEGNLNSFINEVKAQTGKVIETEAAAILIRDAQQIR
jgi:rhamnogalacturonan endolyase